MRRSLVNLVLLAITAALTAVVWFAQKKEEKGPPLTSLEQDAITRILIEHPGKPAVRLVKESGKWKLVEPVQADTDPFEINGILEVAGLEVKQKIIGTVDRRELGLESPSYTVTLDDQKIAIGGTEPIKYRRYVATGELVGLVDDPPSAALDDNYSDLVSRAIVPEGAAIAKLELPNLTIQKTPAGEWGATQQPQAKTAQVARLVESWKNAKALWNSADEPPTNAGEHVRIALEDGRMLDLYVTAKDPQLVLASPALRVRYTLSKMLATELFAIPAEEKAAEDKKDALVPSPVPEIETP